MDKLPSGEVFVLDTETGGFSPEANPLLSIGLLRAIDGEVVDTLEIQLATRQDWWLEVPTVATMGLDIQKKEIEYFLNCYDGSVLGLSAKPRVGLITARAAEVNGYVTFDEAGHWDFGAMRKWDADSVDGATATKRLLDFIAAADSPTATIAHHADFDAKFIKRSFPEVYAALPPWFCTMQYYRDKFNAGKSGGSGLQAIMKTAGISGEVQHFGLSDAIDCHAVWCWLRSQP